MHNLVVSSISYANSLKGLLKGTRTVLVVATANTFTKKRMPKLLGKRNDELMLDLAKDVIVGDLGGVATTLTGKEPRQIAVGALPNQISRYNAPSRASSVRRVVAGVASGKGKLGIILVVEDPCHLSAQINAIGQAFPQFNAKTSKSSPRRVQIFAVDSKGAPVELPGAALVLMAMTRDSAELVDTPPAELNPGSFAARAKTMLAGLKGVKVKEIVGDKLLAEKLGGIHAVGRAAASAPRLFVATFSPKKSTSRHVALVGKGVTYDTGGLHIKPRGGMEGMKCDMGGAAAVLGAFRVLVQGGCEHRLSLILCLAENALNEKSYKPDDILTMHSGKSVEINNTDAEGRLLLADGVSYAARVLEADTIFDAATLTGAQMVALGINHAAVMSNDGELEQAVVQAGRRSGDLAHALPFAPEFYKGEFTSQVADMCNSVRNRMNAQSSCAAQFVYWHIDDTEARWCHIDLAGPAFPKGRGTGYGVALLAEAVSSME